MPIIYIKNWQSTKFTDIIDVRSQKEYIEDHIPNSINLPVLNNSQRQSVGTIYSQDNPFKAKKIGAAIISKNIGKIINLKFLDKPGNWKPLIYCWRGGQRSKSLAITLSEIGWQVYVLQGGYKTYRKHINLNINKLAKNMKFLVLRGPTGSAKTKILRKLEIMGCPTLNLEKLANHKGSLLGKNPRSTQPSQKLFESNLYKKLYSLKKAKIIMIESESSKIGNIYLPSTILRKIEESNCIDINAGIEARVEFLIKDYSRFLLNSNNFNELFEYAKLKLGNKIVEKWKESLNKKNWKLLAYQLINEYYDPLYDFKKGQKQNQVLESFHFKSLNESYVKNFCKYLKDNYF